MKKNTFQKIILILMIMSLTVVSHGATRYKWITIGSLQNFYYDTGMEWESIVYGRQQWGFTWESFWRDQDMQAAKGMWIGVKNFFDPVMNREYPYKIAHNGPRAVTDIEIREYIPLELKLVARNAHPEVYVDDNEGSDMMNGLNAKNDDVDEIDANILVDRQIVNSVNTSVGISFVRNVYAVSQQNYDDIHIIEYEFENTGIYNAEGDVYEQTLQDVYFHWQWRDAIAQEGCWNGAYNSYRNWISTSVRDVRWGYSMMFDVIGEDQANPQTTSIYEDMTGLDAQDDDGDWMRGYVAWMGKWSDFGYDNIGSPLVNGVAHNDYSEINDGRLGAAQYKGAVVIHADTSPSDNTDDSSQPKSNAYINSNAAYTFTAGLDQYDEIAMSNKYQMYMSNGDMGSFSEKVWTTTGGDAGTFSSNTSAAGYSQMLAFGPYTLAPGDKIKIVFAECAAGLGHENGYSVGQQWYKAKYEGETVTVMDPEDRSNTISITSANANWWKDAMVYSGRDSLMKTFNKAINLYEGGFYNTIPEAPLPPATVEIFSTEDGVKISWDGSTSVANSSFEGFRVYRAFIEKDSTYRVVEDLNVTDGSLETYRVESSNVFEFYDTEPLRGQNYYYYITAYDDGTQNLLEPGVELESSPFYTRTNRGATVKSPPAPNEKLNIEDYDLDDPADRKELMEFIVKVVPNPINVRNEQIQFVGNVNKLLFAGVPTGCNIKIFTERGDFVTDVEESEEGFAWYLTTEWQQILVSGVYIAYFVMEEDFEDTKTGVRFDQGDTIVKKFIIIR